MLVSVIMNNDNMLIGLIGTGLSTIWTILFLLAISEFSISRAWLVIFYFIGLFIIITISGLVGEKWGS